MKNYLYLYIVVIIAVMTGCVQKDDMKISSDQLTANESKSIWPKDGIYFMESYGYMAWYSDEEITIQLPFVEIHKSAPPMINIEQIREVSLLGTNTWIECQLKNLILGADRENLTLYTIEVTIPQLDTGIYGFSEISFLRNNSEERYDIGTWNLDIIERTYKDIEIGRTTFIASEFNQYSTEIKNISNKSIEIDGLYYDLGMLPVNNTMLFGNDFNMSELFNDETIKSKETRGIRWIFSTEEKSSYNFITLKPILLFRSDDVNYRICLNAAFIVPVLNEESILQLMVP